MKVELKGVTLHDDDLIIGFDYSEGRDKTCVSMSMTVGEYNDLKRLAQIGRAAEKAFECGYISTFDDIWTLGSIDELLEWNKEYLNENTEC